MPDARGPRKKKAAPDAAAELPQAPPAGELRRQAEERLAALSDAASAPAAPAPEELAAAVHELRVHQIELEMQNEELRRAQLEADALRAKYADLFHLAPVGYFTLGDKGIVGEANLTAAGLLGVERRQLVGQPFSAFVFAAGREEYYRLLQLLKQAEEPQSCELRLRPLGGEPFWAHLEGRPQSAAADEPRRYHLTFTDVDERVRAEEALRDREEQLARAVGGSGVGLWDWYPQTGEETFNERWAEIVGSTLAELAPTSIETWRDLCHPGDLQRADVLLEEHFAGHTDIYSCETRMRHKDGRWVWVLDRGRVSEWDGDGRPLRMIGTELDITERKRAEEALRESEERHRAMFEKNRAIKLVVDPETAAILDANPAACEFYGYSRDELLARKITDINVAPAAEVSEAMARAGGEHVTSFIFQHRLASGELRDVEVNSGPFETGGRTLLFSIIHDITERRRAEEALKRSERSLQAALDGLSASIAVLDDSGTILLANHTWRAFAEENGLAADAVSEGANYLQVCDAASGEHATEAAPFAAGIRAVLCGEADSFVLEYPCDSPGETRWFIGRVTVFPSEGAPQVVVAHEDITARQRAEEELQKRNLDLGHLNEKLQAEAAALAAANATITRIAATDDLTGLANRRQFYSSLEKAVSLSRRHGCPMALVSLDLDGLKRVNDAAGHEAGDEVLASFAALLIDLCRAEDLPGRLGGDEFSVLLPGMERGGARGLAERVLAAVRACDALARRGVTVSAGVAQWSSKELPDDFLRRADKALYAAKRAGGDAVAGDG